MKIKKVRLISEMATSGITLIQLSEMSGVSRATISAVRNGKSCSFNTAAKIAKALHINVMDLIESED